VHLYCSA